MTVRLLIGDVRAMLRDLPADSVDCVVTSPPYWGLRDYGVDGQIGLERTLGEHLDVMVDVFDEVRRVMKPEATLWLNYGDCYATKPNGRSAADTKAAGSDDRTFRDKPFSTVGPIRQPLGGVIDPVYEKTARSGVSENLGNTAAAHGARVVGIGPILKPKDLCMIPNRLAIALQEAGWWVRSEIIWGKPNGMPDSSGKYRPSTSHEKIFLLSKAGDCFYDETAVAQPVSDSTHARMAQDVEAQLGSDRAVGKLNGRMKAVRNQTLNVDAGKRADFKGMSSFVESRYLRNYEPAPPAVWHIPVAGFSEAHFATFPPELAERCIRAGCPPGGVVLDPFGGAGTTGLVADRLQREAILIELNPEYAEIARRRINSDAGFLFQEVEVANG